MESHDQEGTWHIKEEVCFYPHFNHFLSCLLQPLLSLSDCLLFQSSLFHLILSLSSVFLFYLSSSTSFSVFLLLSVMLLLSFFFFSFLPYHSLLFFLNSHSFFSPFCLYLFHCLSFLPVSFIHFHILLHLIHSLSLSFSIIFSFYFIHSLSLFLLSLPSSLSISPTFFHCISFLNVPLSLSPIFLSLIHLPSISFIFFPFNFFRSLQILTPCHVPH